MNRWEPLRQLVLARLREFLREPAAVFWVYGFPMIMIVTLGMAFRSQPIEAIRVVVQRDGDDDPRAAAIAEALGKFERFEIETLGATEGAIRLRTGKADLIIVGKDDSATDGSDPAATVQEGASGPLASGVEYRFDPTRPGSLLARDAAHDALQRAAGRVDRFEASDVAVSEPGSRYVDFLVPGLIGMSLMGGGMWGVGFAIVDMRIRRLLKRFLATPMRRSDFLIGMMISRLIFMIPEFVLLLVFARVAFGVSSAGGYLPVIVLILLGAVQFAGIGLLIASRASTIETVSGLMNLVMLPMWIFGGIFFSNERFPAIMQPLIQVLPITPLIGGLRRVMLEGATLIDLAPQLGLMALWSAVSFAIALRFFRWN